MLAPRAAHATEKRMAHHPAPDTGPALSTYRSSGPKLVGAVAWAIKFASNCSNCPIEPSTGVSGCVPTVYIDPPDAVLRATRDINRAESDAKRPRASPPDER